MSDKFNAFKVALHALIGLNERNRLDAAENRLSLSPLDWAMEYCIVRCDIGRQVGKSRFISENATKSDLIVCPNRRMAERLQASAKCEVLSASSFIPGSPRRKKYRRVWVEEPEFIFRRFSCSEFIAHFVRERDAEDTLFVILGV